MYIYIYIYIYIKSSGYGCGVEKEQWVMYKVLREGAREQ